ncbi:radical SAM protein [Cytophagia bacterium CHB2]|nr:radical SAM protein [Cytophagia bacterium CHB2]
MATTIPIIHGRGANLNPANRFEPIALEIDPEWLNEEGLPAPQTHFFIDSTRGIISKSDSPDLGQMYSLNPYRGCEHGCIYCYARPSHEYFGWSSGLDFETKILVKPDAPELLAQEFEKRSWKPQTVVLSGNTDCYQLAERRLRITRGCLEVFLRYRNPVGIITKNALVLRDLDLLAEMAKLNLVAVTLSITTLDNQLCRKMEPRTSAPERTMIGPWQLTSPRRRPVTSSAAPLTSPSTLPPEPISTGPETATSPLSVPSTRRPPLPETLPVSGERAPITLVSEVCRAMNAGAR